MGYIFPTSSHVEFDIYIFIVYKRILNVLKTGISFAH